MSSRRNRMLVLVLVLIAAVCAAAVVLVPRWVKERIIAAAAAQGVALTIDDLVILPGHATITGVRATPLIRTDQKGAPNVAVTAPKATVTLDGLTPTEIQVIGAQVSLEGSASDVRAVLASRDKRGTDSTPPIERVQFQDASVTWKHPFDGKLVLPRAEHVTLDVTRRGGRALGVDWHLEVPALSVWDPPAATRWALTADQDTQGTRGTLTLGHGATVKLDLATSGARSLDVDTPAATPVELGLPVALLGLSGDETSRFELHLHHRTVDATHATGTLTLSASSIFLGPAPARTQLAVDAKYEGDPATGLEITDGTLRAGPFSGPIRGGFSLPGGTELKADFRLESGAITCADAIKAQAGSLGDVGQGVAALASFLGLDKAVDGSVRLEGMVAIDTQRGVRTASFKTHGDCKLSYLPSP